MGITTLNIKSSSTLFLDTNIFIYALESEKKLGDLARNILQEIKKVHPKVCTSVLTIEEVLVGVYKQKLEEKIPFYLEFISGNGLISIVDIEKEIAMQAAWIRAEFNTKTPDALQLATALYVKATLFVSADRRLPKKIGKLTMHILTD